MVYTPKPNEIIALGTEGGDCKIFARKENDSWIFWQEGSSIYLDENDDESWRSWKSEPTNNLMGQLPNAWIYFYPLFVEEAWRETLTQRFENAVEHLDDEKQKSHYRSYGVNRWKDVLSGQTESDDWVQVFP